MANAMGSRADNAGNGSVRANAKKAVGSARGRVPSRIVVIGLSPAATRAVGRLVGKHFYIERNGDSSECLRRLRGGEEIGGMVIDPGLYEFDAPAFVNQIRRLRPELPLFFYGSVQDLAPISGTSGPENVYCFRNPSDICRMAEAIVVELSKSGSKPLPIHPKDTIVSKALEFIESNYGTIKRVEDISSHVGVSREHLSRQFTRYAGHRLSEFVNIFRIERAKELLMEGVLVKQVFSRVGFRCSSSFFKAFLKHTGIAPSVYKDAMLVRTRTKLTDESGKGRSTGKN